MKAFALVLIAILASGCDYLAPTVTSNYDTLAEARADELFARGWLPDILPESAVDIRTSNNLDLNYSVGEFSFVPADASKFFGRLSAGAPARAPFASWRQTVADYREDGYGAWSYADDSGTWAFFCRERKGQCEYFFWIRR